MYLQKKFNDCSPCISKEVELMSNKEWDRQTDRQTDGQGKRLIPLNHYRSRGIKILLLNIKKYN